MATEQYFENDYGIEENSSLEDWKTISAAVPDSDNNKGLDCNICLESVQDPVVTLCGHLYCWPCIYKWLYFQSISNENASQQQQQCPVCKAEVSHTTLVPLYGRGQTTELSEKKAYHLGLVIPQRPASPASRTSRSPDSGPAPNRGYYLNQSQPYYPHLGNYGDSSAMFGEVAYSGMFRSSAPNLYSYPNSYHLAGASNLRVRRHLMNADKSLSRICFFLCCSVLLCLLLF